MKTVLIVSEAKHKHKNVFWNYFILDTYSSDLKSESSFNERFETLEDLGKGRFGIVCKVKEYQSNRIFASKFVKCIRQQDKAKVATSVFF